MSEILSNEQREFMTFCRDQQVLRLDAASGFKLKSGRQSPWFFNAGNLMQTGEGLAKLARIYVDTLLRGFGVGGKVDTDILYGPAYKGIPLASQVVAELYRQTGQNLGFASHRKEGKDHGADVGRGFAKSVTGSRSILIDDVITAGTAARDATVDIQGDKGTVNGMVVLLDRQEVTGGANPPQEGEPRISAVMDLMKQEGIQVVPALTFAHIRKAIEEGLIGDQQILEAMIAYNRLYGVGVE